MTEQLTNDEVARLRRLLDEDEIRKLRLLYSQLMDAGRIDELAEIFTEDAVCRFGDFGDWEGRSTIRDNFAMVDRDSHGGVPFHAMHSNSDHWIEFTGADSAVGRGYLIDIVTQRAPDAVPIAVIGVYDEEYRRVSGSWQIARCALQFLWPRKQVSDDFEEPFGSQPQE
ncbi:MAG: nuclear transport factor 2 family protein [Acidimicrobiales bacterium]